MSETIEIEGDLVLSEDRTFDKSIRVEGDIKREEGMYPDLVVKGDIDAWDIDAGNIEAVNIDAWNIDARNINAGNIDAWDIEADDIDAWNIDAGNIDAWDIDYYARLFAYKSISYTGEINAKRVNHAEPIALDGTVERKEPEEKEHECPKCGGELIRSGTEILCPECEELNPSSSEELVETAAESSSSEDSDESLTEIPDLTDDEMVRLMDILQDARDRTVTSHEAIRIERLYRKVTKNV